MQQTVQKEPNDPKGINGLHTATPLILDIGHCPLLPPIHRRRDVPVTKPLRTPFGLKNGRGEAQARGLEFMVGEISKGIERKSIRRIAQAVVLIDIGKVVLKHTQPVELLFFWRVWFSILLAPSLKELGGGRWRSGRRGRRRQRSVRENKRKSE